MRQTTTKPSLSSKLLSSAQVQSNMLDDNNINNAAPGGMIQTAYYYPSEEIADEAGFGGEEESTRMGKNENKRQQTQYCSMWGTGTGRRRSYCGGSKSSSMIMCPTNDDVEDRYESFGLPSIFSTIDKIDQIFKYYWHQQPNEEEKEQEQDRREPTTTTTTNNNHSARLHESRYSSSNFHNTTLNTPLQHFKTKMDQQQQISKGCVTKYHRQIRRPPTIKRLAEVEGGSSSGRCCGGSNNKVIKISLHDDIVRTQSVEFLFPSSL